MSIECLRSVGTPLEVVAGPGGVARALSNTSDGEVSGSLVAACAIADGEARWRG